MKRDQYADGTGKYSTGPLTFGMRKVKKGGIIKFDGFNWQDDILLDYVGEYVQVHSDYDSPGSHGPLIIKSDLGVFARQICRIKTSVENLKGEIQ